MIRNQNNLHQEQEAGGEESIGVEIAKLYRQLYARALFLTQNADAANDLVQQVCERGLRMHRTFRPETNLAALLKRILRNLFVDQYRSQRWQVPWEGETEDCAATEERLTPVDLLTFNDAHEGIGRMRPRDRDVLRLAYIDGLTYQEIAHRIGLSPKTVGTRLFRAKAKLREDLQCLFEAKLADLRAAVR
jgi:RNA polymerase sigma-70 factor (ECF subfamily)